MQNKQRFAAAHRIVDFRRAQRNRSRLPGKPDGTECRLGEYPVYPRRKFGGNVYLPS